MVEVYKSRTKPIGYIGKKNSGDFSYTALSLFTYQLRAPVLPPSKVIGIGILLILIKAICLLFTAFQALFQPRTFPRSQIWLWLA
jgi:hypothetical protein